MQIAGAQDRPGNLEAQFVAVGTKEHNLHRWRDSGLESQNIINDLEKNFLQGPQKIVFYFL